MACGIMSGPYRAARRGGDENVVTMADVAREAGVSLNTVSRALNNKPDINPQTRAHILAVINRLGYIPHASARSLASGRTRTLSVTITNMALPVFSGIIDAAQRIAGRRGYTVLLTSTDEDPDKEERAIATLREHQVAGIILTPVETRYAHLAQLREWNIPTVLVNRDVPALGLDYVGSDKIGAARDATAHLIGLGHRRLAFIGAEPTTSTPHARLAGFRAALDVHDITPDERLIRTDLRDLVDYEGAHRAARELLMGGTPFTALVLHSSYVAPGVYRAFREAGVRVPDDVALVSIGGFDLAPYLDVPLTHISHSFADAGVVATELLLRRVTEGWPKEPEKAMMPHTLVVLDSCGGRAAHRSMPATARGGTKLKF